jgi:methionyl-tRNA formyltransferase
VVIRSRLLPGPAAAPPGSLLLDRPGLAVATGDGILELLQVKPEGSRIQSGLDFRNGRRPGSGERLE